MTYLKNVLATVFSGDVGLTDKGIQDALISIRNNPDKRELTGIKTELEACFNDAETNWISILDNEDCEIYYAKSQDDARNYVIAKIWNPLFPDEMRDA